LHLHQLGACSADFVTKNLVRSPGANNNEAAGIGHIMNKWVLCPKHVCAIYLYKGKWVIDVCAVN